MPTPSPKKTELDKS